MPSKRVSSARVDYVPALCTHRPSLLPIEWLSEAIGLAPGGWQRPPGAGKLDELGHLEEVKVVTRFRSAEQKSNVPSQGSTLRKPLQPRPPWWARTTLNKLGPKCKSAAVAAGDTFELTGTP
jgi:hypothetical protein